MSKEKEFKKICENWEGWINEQAPRRAGDYVDPDDQQSGYMRTKKGVEKIASIPRPDDELAIPGMNPEAEKELNKKIVKQQTKRGMEYFKSEDQFLNFWNIMAEEWNGNPAASFLFKIPGQKGAPKDYSWGNFAVDLAILAAGVVPPLAGLLAQAGNVVKAGTAAKIAANPKAKALLFAAALRAPKVANKAAAMMTQKVFSGKAIDLVAQKPILMAVQSIGGSTVDRFEAGKSVTLPFTPKHISTMINVARNRGKLKELMKDKEFVQAARDAGVIGKKG